MPFHFIPLNIQIIQNQTLIPINPLSVEKLVISFTAFHQVNFDEAAIHFVDTETICNLHDEYFNDPSTTDCISFPMDSRDATGYRMLGDVFVCPETALNYVKITGGDVYHEITLYTVHGLLHLLGYDDIEDSDQKVMRAEEKRFLDHVIANGLWIKK